MRRPIPLLAVLAASALLAGCAPEVIGDPAPVPSATSAPSGSPSATPVLPVEPTGTTSIVATGLETPWSVVPLEAGGGLVSERDTALVKQFDAAGEVRVVGEIPDVAPEGEGGLLGIARWVSADGDPWLYAYTTTSTDNRVIRMPLTGSPDALALGAAEVVFSSLPKNTTHNGGRIAFGPDGMLYVTAGDTQNRPGAQELEFLGGKILRLAPDGAVPADNPFDGSPVYSLGHRNPQGIAWDADGQLWAAEFGQNTWDEFNVIDAGANYGWPVVEGIGDDPAYVNPVYQWATSEASPSGLGYVDGAFFLAALRGQRLWAIYPATGATEAVPHFAGEFGRLRDAVPAPDGSLWVLTNGVAGGDSVVRVELAPRG